MDESLLFESGKTTVQPKGYRCFKKCSLKLVKTDINVLVEGHTDDVLWLEKVK